MKLVRLLLGIVALTLTVSGCSSSKGSVTVRGDETRATLAQSFNGAYISSSHDGEYDVILVQDPHDNDAGKPTEKTKWSLKRLTELWPGSSETSKPLEPLTTTSLRQVVHLHVFWQGNGGSVARDGVVTNASIHWYVINHGASDRPEILQYSGAGYVLLDEGRNGVTNVRIRDGMMKVASVQGDLQDPIGPSRLNGTVKAQRNSQLVRDTIADLRAQSKPAATVTQAN
jgi:hypothetical protein